MNKKSFLIELCIFLSIAAVLEIALHVWDRQYLNLVFNEKETGGYPISFNHEGFRGEEIPIEKHPNELRILALGDSVTFGTGLPYQLTWPAQLQTLLTQKFNVEVQVINTALPATSIQEIDFAIKTLWNKYDAKYYILAVSDNLVTLSWIRRDQPDKLPHNDLFEFSKSPEAHTWRHQIQSFTKSFLSDHIALFSFLKNNIEKGLYWLGIWNHNVDPKAPYGGLITHGWQQVGLDPDISKEAWNFFGEQLEKLNQTVNGLGSKLIIVSVPARFMLSDLFRDNQKSIPKKRLSINPSMELEEMGKALNIPTVNLVPLFLEERANGIASQGIFKPLYILNDYTHLDQEGNHILAESLLPYIANTE